MRSSTADTQITTINEQHGGLKTTKFENCGKISKCIIHATIGTNSSQIYFFTVKFKRIFTLFEKSEERPELKKLDFLWRFSGN